jgi:bacillolysin/neutral peptidase B
MKQYLNTAADHGGVHFNCTIHTRAAVGVLMARDKAGNRVFTSREVAILYYLCLLRLPPLATFAKTLQTLVDVANDYFAGTPSNAARKVEHIRAAYREAGIA